MCRTVELKYDIMCSLRGESFPCLQNFKKIGPSVADIASFIICSIAHPQRPFVDMKSRFEICKVDCLSLMLIGNLETSADECNEIYISFVCLHAVADTRDGTRGLQPPSPQPSEMQKCLWLMHTQRLYLDNGGGSLGCRSGSATAMHCNAHADWPSQGWNNPPTRQPGIAAELGYWKYSVRQKTSAWSLG